MSKIPMLGLAAYLRCEAGGLHVGQPSYITLMQWAKEVDATALTQPDPTTGNWIAADDVQRMALQLDVAMNGRSGAAVAPSLCDVISQAVAKFHYLSQPAKLLYAPAALPTQEQIELIARDMCQNKELDWVGFRKDSHGRYTIPELSPSVYKLVLGAIKYFLQPVQPALPLMSAAFRTTRTGGGKYEMVFSFRDFDALRGADAEWRNWSLAAPVAQAEPIGWMDGADGEFYSPNAHEKFGYGSVPVYTHNPVVRSSAAALAEPLSDERRDVLVNSLRASKSWTTAYAEAYVVDYFASPVSKPADLTWCKDCGEGVTSFCRGNAASCNLFVAQPEPLQVPNGWKLVPIEPTKEMWDAVNKLDDQMAAGGFDGEGCSIEQAWDCLLDAAPPSIKPKHI